ncbi:hypothetical protein DEJ48_20355 [Streptomyces venezuelae]|uniref:Uncharacterized protein n=1 Tax=Streptomyces venezuelae TaxID=54571 RepID=A0A5P2C0M1_STRVZ|nr:hypothetical protein [Streptomyces venezuelae]QES35468.1 hypothetical protein DEJ48_20355 [Streptomyces venezuelae]
MSDGSVKPIKERVADLESQIQEFTTKFEHGWAKAETVGAAGAATGASGALTGVSGEATLVSTGAKLINLEWDLLSHLEKKRLERNGEDPTSLKRAGAEAKQKAIEASTKADRVDQRVTDVARELNRKIARKADLSDLRSTASRHDSQLEGLRSSQVNALNREARQATVTVQALEDEIARLNARF